MFNPYVYKSHPKYSIFDIFGWYQLVSGNTYNIILYCYIQDWTKFKQLEALKLAVFTS